MTSTVDERVLDWLLEPTNPTARWLTLRLLLGRADDDPDVLDAQSRVPGSRWAQAVLSGRRPDGSWPRGRTSKPELRATVDRLSRLAALGMPADDPRVTTTCELLLERTTLPGEGFSMQKTKPRSPHECGQGMLLFVLNHFGYGADDRVQAAATWLLANQMLDGGWNCAHPDKGRLQPDGAIRMNHECSLDAPHHKSSLFSTMAALKGLATVDRPPRKAISGGIEVLLAHRVHRARGSNRAIYRWPPRLDFLGGGYDGLHPLRVLVLAGAKPDPRLDEALAYLERRAIDGRWRADNTTPNGRPDKWITVHALHVLRALRTPEFR